MLLLKRLLTGCLLRGGFSAASISAMILASAWMDALISYTLSLSPNDICADGLKFFLFSRYDSFQFFLFGFQFCFLKPQSALSAPKLRFVICDLLAGFHQVL